MPCWRAADTRASRRSPLRPVPLLLLLAACDAGPTELAEPRAPLAVFPSARMVSDGALALPDLPQAATPMPHERLRWRTGFSRVQTVVLRPPVRLDPASLPPHEDALMDGSVQLWDLDDRRPLRCFAEVDAWPGYDDEVPALLVRPLERIPTGHRTAVILTDAVRTEDGEPLPSPDWFNAWEEGREADEDADAAAGTRALLDTLDSLDVEGVVLAEPMPPADPGTATLDTLVEDLQVPETWSFDEVRTGSDLPPRTAKVLEGRFTTDDWLGDAGSFTLDARGLPVRQGTTEAVLYIHVSQGATRAEPGTAPVWLFGHGIFANPERYLDDEDDENGLLALADEAGAIVVATVWRGLTTSDATVAVTVGTDFGRVHELTDKLQQGVANTIALSWLLTRGTLLEDPALDGLPDLERVSYYGISLGGVEGPLVARHDPDLDQVLLHVGGGVWSTMLERSSNWSGFESLIQTGVPDPYDRQILYAYSQLFWDPVDPANHLADAGDPRLLWQLASADEQVPNLTSWVVARASGATMVGPSVASPAGLAHTDRDPDGPAVVLWDTARENHDATNRPAPVTGAHVGPRAWPVVQVQSARFLTTGRVEHPCDQAECAD